MDTPNKEGNDGDSYSTYISGQGIMTKQLPPRTNTPPS